MSENDQVFDIYLVKSRTYNIQKKKTQEKSLISLKVRFIQSPVAAISEKTLVFSFYCFDLKFVKYCVLNSLS